MFDSNWHLIKGLTMNAWIHLHFLIMFTIRTKDLTWISASFLPVSTTHIVLYSSNRLFLLQTYCDIFRHWWKMSQFTCSARYVWIILFNQSCFGEFDISSTSNRCDQFVRVRFPNITFGKKTTALVVLHFDEIDVLRERHTRKIIMRASRFILWILDININH